MNRKGFTLIELLAVIVVFGVVASLVSTGIISMYKKAKEKSYNILIENIRTAGENYFQECEYGDLKDGKKYGSLACVIKNEGESESYTEATLEKLVKLGILKASNKDKEDTNVVVNPKTNKILNACLIEIAKYVDDVTFNTVYEVKLVDNGEENCLSLTELQ